jgi:hypothetical protein
MVKIWKKLYTSAQKTAFSPYFYSLFAHHFHSFFRRCAPVYGRLRAPWGIKNATQVPDFALFGGFFGGDAKVFAEK